MLFQHLKQQSVECLKGRGSLEVQKWTKNFMKSYSNFQTQTILRNFELIQTLVLEKSEGYIKM